MISQTEKPLAGEPVATMETDRGTIKIRLFPQAAPKAVENFVTHAREGYYDNLIFHRVIDGFMIQGGDPTGTGRGGESIWGNAFEDEFYPELHNIRGALSMANSGRNTNGSQFFIVQAGRVEDSMLRQMEGLEDKGFPKESLENYKTMGGTPWLDYRHTVFGQVYEGMDTVDSIAASKVGMNDKPVEDIRIKSVAIDVAG